MQKQLNKVLTVLLLYHFFTVLLAQTMIPDTEMNSVSTSLMVAGIKSMKEASNRLINIASYVNYEGPQLIVHSVNWYHYNPLDLSKTKGWNGIGTKKDTITLTSKPLFNYYSCNDPLYIDWILGFSEALGIDELNIDYEGGVDYPQEFEAYYNERSWDSWFMDLLLKAENYPIKISVMYEPKSIAWRLASRQGTKSKIETTDPEYPVEAIKLLKTDLKTICDKFTIKKNENNEPVINPVYKRLAGLPVIWVFWMTAGSLTENIWKQAIEELYHEGYAFILVANTYKDEQSCFDPFVQGMNPWLDQLFTGFQTQYPDLWNSAQEAAGKQHREEAKRITNQYINELEANGLFASAPIRNVSGPANFNITPLAIGFQDADVNGWGFRPPVYFESYDRTQTEPGKLFRTYFTAAKESKNQWFLICSGDDMAERSHMLIPDIEFGFSGPYAIALTSGFLGKKPDIHRAIRLTEYYVRKKNKGSIPDDIQPIFKEAKKILPHKLKQEVRNFRN